MKTKLLKIVALITFVTLILISAVSCSEKEFEGISLTDVTVVYSQSGHNVTIVGEDKYPNATFTLSEDKINVGVYTQVLTVTQEGYKPFEATATLTINKAIPENLLPTYNGSYSFVENTISVIRTGSPIIITPFTNFEQQPYATVEYYHNQTKLESAPIEAGTYNIKLSVPEVDNYYALEKNYTLVIKEQSYLATFKILNPITNELESAYLNDLECVKQYDRNSLITLPDDIGEETKFDGYTFIGWYVDNELLHENFDYDNEIVVIGKYVKI